MPNSNQHGPYYTRVEQSNLATTALLPANWIADSPNNRIDVEVTNKNLKTTHGTSTNASGTNAWGPFYLTV